MSDRDAESIVLVVELGWSGAGSSSSCADLAPMTGSASSRAPSVKLVAAIHSRVGGYTGEATEWRTLMRLLAMRERKDLSHFSRAQ